jgi:iron complex transport system substrate-binding protein
MTGAPVRPQTAVARRAVLVAARVGAVRRPVPSGARAGAFGIVSALGAVLASSVLVSLLLVGTVAGGLRAASAASSEAASRPITIVDDRGRAVVMPEPARRIVSLLPSLTETVCALDACEHLVGVDRSSNWPASIAALPRLGGLEDTQIERIVALRPDVVLAASSLRAIERLESLGVRVLALEPKGFEDTRRVLRAVAQVLGRPPEGDALWAQIDARITAAAARVPASMRGLRTYFEVSETPHAASEGSFVGEMLARLGLRNVVPASLGPFPQLNPEFIVRAAPELVIGSARSVTAMPARPGWAALPALRDRRSCAIEPARYEAIVRPGPRLGEAAEFLADCLVTLEARRP